MNIPKVPAVGEELVTVPEVQQVIEYLMAKGLSEDQIIDGFKTCIKHHVAALEKTTKPFG